MTAHFIYRFSLIALGFAVFLGGCVFGGGSGEIKPVYSMRNSPIPVPWPKEKPPPPPRPGSGAQQAETAPPSQTSGTITVAKGDTVYAISQRTGVAVRQIIVANNLKAPYILHPGDTLVLTGGRVYQVEKGDTLYSISRAYGVDLKTLTRANNLKRPFTLAIGQQIQIPGGGSAPVRQTVLDVTLPPREGSKFMWPVTGKILSSFGPKEGGLHNDGINIQARRGDQVKAADAGVVVYAGDDLKGYGNLLLIRHSGGWVTAYAHNDRLLVKRGDRVKRGQVIAWVGITGGVGEAQLHFEIRKGTVAVDPMKYLGG